MQTVIISLRKYLFFKLMALCVNNVNKIINELIAQWHHLGMFRITMPCKEGKGILWPSHSNWTLCSRFLYVFYNKNLYMATVIEIKLEGSFSTTGKIGFKRKSSPLINLNIFTLIWAASLQPITYLTWILYFSCNGHSWKVRHRLITYTTQVQYIIKG